MTRFKAQGLSPDQLPQSPAAEWRQRAFQWLRLATNDRRIAAFCARESENNYCRVVKQGSIERHAAAIADACERDAWARQCGHVLP